MSSDRIRVMCVDDHAIVRAGITHLLEREIDIDVIASVASGEEALSEFRRRQPHVTLMDLELPTMSGLETIHAIRREYPESRFIVLTVYQGAEDMYRVMQAGAATYLLKDTLSDELVRAIREVHKGNRPIGRAIEERLMERAEWKALTPRELQVIELVSHGMRNKEIAVSLGISEVTAQVHLKNILAKLSVNDRTAAVRVAAHRGIIHIR